MFKRILNLLEQTADSDGKTPIIFGEALFDQWESDKVAGGAPFNVAWHLAGFGLNPLLISRVGNDEDGKKIRDMMVEWGMRVDGIQLDDKLPTGLVKVTQKKGAHCFDILNDQAYDAIDANITAQLCKTINPELLYFGTLALRNKKSVRALSVLRCLSIPHFVDINLRAPWWDEKTVDATLTNARVVKMNSEELFALTKSDEIERAARQIHQQYELDLLLVTKGSEGAYMVSDADAFWRKPAGTLATVDTVGAGDAFSAVFILGMLKGWPHDKTLSHALSFASIVCRRRGAIIPSKEVYQMFLERLD